MKIQTGSIVKLKTDRFLPKSVKDRTLVVSDVKANGYCHCKILGTDVVAIKVPQEWLMEVSL